MEDVDEKGVVIVFYLRFFVAESNQSGFSHSSGGDDDQIVSVGHGFDQPCRFLHPAAEILGLDFTGYDERVRCFCHVGYFSAKVIIRFELCKSNYVIRIIYLTCSILVKKLYLCRELRKEGLWKIFKPSSSVLRLSGIRRA